MGVVRWCNLSFSRRIPWWFRVRCERMTLEYTASFTSFSNCAGWNLTQIVITLLSLCFVQDSIVRLQFSFFSFSSRFNVVIYEQAVWIIKFLRWLKYGVLTVKREELKGKEENVKRVDRLSTWVTANYCTIDLMALYSSVIHDNSPRAFVSVQRAAVSIGCPLKLTRTRIIEGVK